MDVKVEVKGLGDLARAFKQVDRELNQEMKRRLKDVVQGVADTAIQRMPHRTGRAQTSVKARASDRGGAIAAGGTAAPYYPFLDFGGSVGRGHVPGVGGSGAIKRSMPDGGRYIYPALIERRDDINKGVEEAVEEVAKQAGFDVWLDF